MSAEGAPARTQRGAVVLAGVRVDASAGTGGPARPGWTSCGAAQPGPPGWVASAGPAKAAGRGPACVVGRGPGYAGRLAVRWGRARAHWARTPAGPACAPCTEGLPRAARIGAPCRGGPRCIAHRGCRLPRQPVWASRAKAWTRPRRRARGPRMDRDPGLVHRLGPGAGRCHWGANESHLPVT